MARQTGSSGAKPGQWGVLDLTAKQGPRIHEVADGVAYPLSATSPTFMPTEHAMVFLCNEAFRVTDEEGNPVASLPTDVVSPTAAGPRRLEPGTTVARYEELGQDALVARAVRRPGGGQQIKKNTPKRTIIEFLHRTDRDRLAGLTDRDGLSDHEFESMGDDETRRLLGTPAKA